MDDEAKIPENMCENIPNSIQCVRVRDEHDDTPSGPVRCVSGFDQCCMSDVVTTMGNHTQTHHSWLVGQIFRSIFRFFNQVFSVRFSTQFTRRDETFRKNGEQEKKTFVRTMENRIHYLSLSVSLEWETELEFFDIFAQAPNFLLSHLLDFY